jgi:hypothetical protein
MHSPAELSAAQSQHQRSHSTQSGGKAEAMPHGLTVQELKELTRMRLAKKAGLDGSGHSTSSYGAYEGPSSLSNSAHTPQQSERGRGADVSPRTLQQQQQQQQQQGASYSPVRTNNLPPRRQLSGGSSHGSEHALLRRMGSGDSAKSGDGSVQQQQQQQQPGSPATAAATAALPPRPVTKSELMVIKAERAAAAEAAKIAAAAAKEAALAALMLEKQAERRAAKQAAKQQQLAEARYQQQQQQYKQQQQQQQQQQYRAASSAGAATGVTNTTNASSSGSAQQSLQAVPEDLHWVWDAPAEQYNINNSNNNNSGSLSPALANPHYLFTEGMGFDGTASSAAGGAKRVPSYSSLRRHSSVASIASDIEENISFKVAEFVLVTPRTAAPQGNNSWGNLGGRKSSWSLAMAAAESLDYSELSASSETDVSTLLSSSKHASTLQIIDDHEEEAVLLRSASDLLFNEPHLAHYRKSSSSSSGSGSGSGSASTSSYGNSHSSSYSSGVSALGGYRNLSVTGVPQQSKGANAAVRSPLGSPTSSRVTNTLNVPQYAAFHDTNATFQQLQQQQQQQQPSVPSTSNSSHNSSGGAFDLSFLKCAPLEVYSSAFDKTAATGGSNGGNNSSSNAYFYETPHTSPSSARAPDSSDEFATSCTATSFAVSNSNSNSSGLNSEQPLSPAARRLKQMADMYFSGR